ncbi:MAG: hypothetical protein ACSHYF_11260 [Verrucomicrobiaceae bacterium]
MKRDTFFVAAIIGGVFSFQLNAQQIGINLGSNRADSALDPTDSAGAVPQENWNNTGGANGGPLALVDSLGDATTAEVTWATDEEWSVGGTPADANGKLLNGFVSENNNDGSQITITGIPFQLYDLYVYVSHDRANEDVILGETNGLFADFTAIENDTDITAAVTFEEQAVSGEGTGNYVLFTGLTATDIEVVLSAIDTNNPAGSIDRNAISGIQIVNVSLDDLDSDGLIDAWEINFGLDPTDDGSVDPNNGPDGDPDGDSSSNLEEQTRATDPTKNDTDGDTIWDGYETGDGNWVSATETGTDPLKKDSDGDTLNDNVEDNGGVLVDAATMTGTNPNKADTDEDGLRDDWEIINMFDPFDDGSTDVNNGPTGDPDSDDLDNAGEQTAGTDPRDDDTDDDTLLDGVETNDGNYVDATATGTDPLDADSDGDTLGDGVEDNTGTLVDETMTGTNPNLADTDGDYLRDDWEIAHSLDPSDPSDNVPSQGGIGLNLGSNRADAALLATDVTGAFPQANWNNLGGSSGGPLVLLDDTGSDVGASVTWQMDEEWSATGPAADANGTLMTGWFSANNGGASNTIDITNIPYGSYDVVFYYNHDRGGEITEVSEANNAFPVVSLRERNPDILAALSFQQQVDSTFDVANARGDFHVISGLSSPTLNLLVNAGTNDRGPLTGIQLVNRGGGGGLSITEIAVDAGDGTVALTWASSPGRTYSIDTSLDLAEGSWLEVVDNVSSAGTSTTESISGIDFGTDRKRFFRVRQVSNAQ